MVLKIPTPAVIRSKFQWPPSVKEAGPRPWLSFIRASQYSFGFAVALTCALFMGWLGAWEIAIAVTLVLVVGLIVGWYRASKWFREGPSLQVNWQESLRRALPAHEVPKPVTAAKDFWDHDDQPRIGLIRKGEWTGRYFYVVPEEHDEIWSYVVTDAANDSKRATLVSVIGDAEMQKQLDAWQSGWMPFGRYSNSVYSQRMAGRLRVAKNWGLDENDRTGI